jgi:hypothetical protein
VLSPVLYFCGQAENGGDAVQKASDKSAWVIGGTTLIGVGAGLIFLKTSALLFVACVLIGIGPVS